MPKRNNGAMFIGGYTKSNVHEREINDFYATPPNTTKSLLDVLDVEPKTILEPSAGMGHIVEVLKEYYPNAKIEATDLIDRGYCKGNVDYLTKVYDKKYDLIITNPPFKYAKEFVQKSLELTNDKVAMLLKIQFLESKSRKEFLKHSHLKYVYVFSERQNTLKNGEEINPLTGKKWSSVFLLAWFVFEKGYEGEPIIRWL
ncbi:class I SAM-dependent methyltransferase [Clostridium perfringens]|uniref:class I SAM-dependent methyltransferase n=1 Tax=Clostridium perfringens TaxID=1502 RepID=UPI00103C3DBE|nr:class I SAM-dependent methyltransferase [Clostridium perfringens]